MRELRRRGNLPVSGKLSLTATQRRPWDWTKRGRNVEEETQAQGVVKGTHKVVSLSRLIHLWIFHQECVRDVLLKNSQDNHSKEGKNHVPEGVGNSIPGKLAREAVHEWEIERDEVQCQRLVERVQDDLGQAAVGKVTVNQEKPLQEAVLGSHSLKEVKHKTKDNNNTN